MPTVLTMKQLLSVCKFAGIEIDPEKSIFAKDKEQLETCFVLSDEPPGACVWLLEYPDEGVFLLDAVHDPLVFDPPDFDIDAARKDCEQVGDDPGVVSCPNCKAEYWAFGEVQQCSICGFKFPVNWWPMYSWGVSAGKRKRAGKLHDERMGNPYYRFGYEHPVEDAWVEHDKIDWKKAIAEG